jgi:hypothetical protein
MQPTVVDPRVVAAKSIALMAKQAGMPPEEIVARLYIGQEDTLIQFRSTFRAACGEAVAA